MRGPSGSGCLPFKSIWPASWSHILHVGTDPLDYTNASSVAELPEFIRASDRILEENERQEPIAFLSFNPRAGVLIEGTGGIRKLRWNRGSRGKSGGVRVIYYFHDVSMPLYLLTVFAKGQRANLSRAQRNTLGSPVSVLVCAWKENR